MAQTLQALAGEFCAILGVATPAISANAEGVVAFSVKTRGVDITIAHDQLREPDDLIILVYFGTVSEAQEVAILRNLLHANFRMWQSQAPAFCCDPESDSIVLKYVHSLAQASGDTLWDGIQSVIDKVHRWRDEPFFREEKNTAAPGGFA